MTLPCRAGPIVERRDYVVMTGHTNGSSAMIDGWRVTGVEQSNAIDV